VHAGADEMPALTVTLIRGGDSTQHLCGRTAALVVLERVTTPAVLRPTDANGGVGAGGNTASVACVRHSPSYRASAPRADIEHRHTGAPNYRWQLSRGGYNSVFSVAACSGRAAAGFFSTGFLSAHFPTNVDSRP